ncbi:MAG: hypothetical protein ABIQ16_17990 [Polyangiaceae bacterium]
MTLTYREADAWAADHVSTAVQRYRDWCRVRKLACRYTWVAEIQPERAKRTGDEVVHYHLLAWLPVGVRMPFWDKPQGRRAAFWSHGWSNTEPARAGIGYLMKYLSKLGELTRFPKGLRLYGIGGLNETGKHVRQWFNLPQWVKRAHGVAEIARTACGFMVRATGEILPAVWSVSRVPAGLLLRRLREVAPRFPEHQVAADQCPGAFSSWGGHGLRGAGG